MANHVYVILTRISYAAYVYYHITLVIMHMCKFLSPLFTKIIDAETIAASTVSEETSITVISSKFV